MKGIDLDEPPSDYFVMEIYGTGNHTLEDMTELSKEELEANITSK